MGLELILNTVNTRLLFPLESGLEAKDLGLHTRGVHREWEFGIPISPVGIMREWNGHGVIREQELVHGSGREWE